MRAYPDESYSDLCLWPDGDQTEGLRLKSRTAPEPQVPADDETHPSAENFVATLAEATNDKELAFPGSGRGNDTTANRQVAWWPVHEFLAAALAQANCGPLPLAGTPAWGVLADDDPAKLLALAVAGEHAALRWETEQQQRAEASKAVAAAVDWPQLARDMHQRATATAYVRRVSP